jgi:hypothetical protein
MLYAVFGERRGHAPFCVALASLLVLTSCARSEQPNDEASEVAEDQDDPELDDDRNKDGKGDVGANDASPAAAPRASGGPHAAHEDAVEKAKDAPPIASPKDGEAVGKNSHFYLNEKVPKLIIEVNAVRGFAPTQAAVDLLVERLKSVVDKPGGIEVRPVEVVGQGRDSWTVAHVRKFEEAHRDVENSSQAAVMHISYVDGESADDALGIAYESSSVVIFAEALRANALPTMPAEVVEKAAIVHEIGHLMALVNIGYKSPRDHHDGDHPGHSKNLESVMYYAVDTIGVYTLFRGLNREPPTDFDADDRADLADLKTGKLP